MKGKSSQKTPQAHEKTFDLPEIPDTDDPVIIGTWFIFHPIMLTESLLYQQTSKSPHMNVVSLKLGKISLVVLKSIASYYTDLTSALIEGQQPVLATALKCNGKSLELNMFMTIMYATTEEIYRNLDRSLLDINNASNHLNSLISMLETFQVDQLLKAKLQNVKSIMEGTLDAKVKPIFCSEINCKVCHKPTTSICSKCSIMYPLCSAACQSKDWPTHPPSCNSKKNTKH